MKKNQILILLFAVITSSVFVSCNNMTKGEAINFNDNVIFCVDDIEKSQVNFVNTSYANPEITTKEVETGFEKLNENSLGYKVELKEVFDDYKHPACKKLKKAFYIFVDEIAEVTEANKEKTLSLVKEYNSLKANNDSIGSITAFETFKQGLLDFHNSTTPVFDKFFSAHDVYVSETEITLHPR